MKELKKKHSSKLVAGAETDSWGGEGTCQGGCWWSGAGKGVAGRLEVLHWHVGKPGETTEE